MYKKIPPSETSLEVNDSYQGESIEEKMARIINNKEPIKDGAPLIYTDRKEGVKPELDIRTDRFETAIETMDYRAKSHIAKRQLSGKEKSLGDEAKEGMNKENDGTSANTNDKGK